MVRPKGVGRREKNDVELQITEAEVQRLLRACQSDNTVNGQRAYALFAMKANLGLRISEMLSLTKDNFRDLESNIVHIWRLKKSKKRRGRARTKRDHSRDSLWVGHKEKQFLKNTLSGLLDRGRLFPFGARMAQYFFAHYLRVAGLRPILTPHSLRRFAATRIMLLRYGEAPMRARLGHAKRAEDRYVSGPDAIIKIMDCLEVIT